ncbi:hypothetical protein [Pseudaestuariivita rosea]|uniref:hypothetical protein n=1 Tax=Pseudaestuariivita rosea TaxID=2763263 RepID=UPI001ABB8C87|nr:hypothetical protein [Pseudaestuariivita rosea]
MGIIVTAEVLLVLTIIIGVIVSDIFLAVSEDGNRHPSGLTGDTYSEVTRYWAKFTPVMPWVWGLLAGRFFHWGQEPLLPDPFWLGVVIMLGITAVVFAIVIPIRKWIWQPIDTIFGMPLAFGLAYVVGSLFWPVESPPIDFL